MNIGIVSIGYGNIAAFEDIFEDFGHSVVHVSQAEDIAGIDLLVLPGVGKFDMAMNELNERGLSRKIREEYGLGQLKIFGVCLGMQLLFETSDEGTERGLGLLKGRFVRILNNGKDYINMGWRFVYSNGGHCLGKFYFIHNYYLSHFDNMEICMTSSINGIPFIAGLRSERLLLTQFHPEKSSHYGELLIRSWLDE